MLYGTGKINEFVVEQRDENKHIAALDSFLANTWFAASNVSAIITSLYIFLV